MRLLPLQLSYGTSVDWPLLLAIAMGWAIVLLFLALLKDL